MAFTHEKLGAALGWKFNNQPGMTTRGGKLVEFPGATPTDTELAQWVAEYEVEEAKPKTKPARPLTLKALIDLLQEQGVIDVESAS